VSRPGASEVERPLPPARLARGLAEGVGAAQGHLHRPVAQAHRRLDGDDLEPRDGAKLPPRVAPLLPVRRLNPVFVVDGAEVVLLPQLIVAVPVGALGRPVARLDAEADAIRVALDMLLSGF
jgi:hypothetical protein